MLVSLFLYWKHHAVYLCICISVLLLLHHAFCIFVTGQHQVEKVWFHILGSKAPCGQFDSNDRCVLTHKEFPCRQNTEQSRSVQLLFYCSYVDDNLRCVVLCICVFVYFLCICVFVSYSSLADANLRHAGSVLCCRFNVAQTRQDQTIHNAHIYIAQYS